ncbi:MAG: IPExxxVDY family protein [Bacteroidales bacterium]|nr:IPExxxVDY family protein [Bacteroidales bacterium]
MKKKIHKLSVELRSRLYIAGISSHENDYRLSWAINNKLGYNLSKSDNLSLTNNKTGEIQQFSVFEFTNEDDECKYHLVSNRCDNGFLLAEYKNVDFFLLIQGEMAPYEFDLIVTNLKQIEIITLAFMISDLSTKSLEKLHF